MAHPADNKNENSKIKLGFLDSLRGIAILMVILVHTSQSVTKLSHITETVSAFGQLGVQLFFVISAFVLSLSMDMRSNEKDKTKRFFIRRFFRIAPLYYFGIIWYFALSSLKETLKAGHFQLSDNYGLYKVLANLTFIHGFYPPANNKIVPGGWSIGTEMAFYLCFPILFFLYKKINEKGILYFSVIFILTTSIYYFAESRYLLLEKIRIENNEFIYFNLLNQLPVFTLGILAYFLSKNQWLARTPNIINLILLSLSIWWTYYLFQISTTYSYSFMFFPFAAGLAFTFLYALFAKIRILNFTILERIGRVSYSMYIFHFIFAWDLSAFLNQQFAGVIHPDILLGFVYVLTILLTYIIAIISERFIEKPGIEVGKMLIQKLSNEPIISI